MKELLIGLGLKFLQALAQSVWDGLWAEVSDAITNAENQWKSGNYGAVKKAWVLNKAVQYLDSRNLIKWYNRRMITLFLDRAIERAVDEINAKLGKNWADHVEDAKRILAAKIPFVN
jgi:hypothetical protein